MLSVMDLVYNQKHAEIPAHILEHLVNTVLETVTSIYSLFALPSQNEGQSLSNWACADIHI